MRYYLSDGFVLKWLETPSVYDIKEDELYELDNAAFEFLKECAGSDGCGDERADNEFIDYCISERILTTEPVAVKRSSLLKSPIPSLRYLELQITDKCNLKCGHCYIGKPKNNEISPDKIKIVLDEFEEMQGLRLLITGGEPLMHSHFDEINTLLPEYNFRKILFTNGLLLNEEVLKGLNVDEIQFSVDGMKRGHEAIRGKGTYKIVMKKIHEAIDAGIIVSIATMVHGRNIDEFDEMDDIFRKIGIKDWTVDVPCVSGNLKENHIFQVPPEIAGRYLNYGFGGGLHGGGEGFACGLHLMSVLADGNICKCAFYSHTPVGNISEGLRKSWQRIMPVKLDELECSDISCRFIDECRGGCRFHAEDSRKKKTFTNAMGMI
ncbi:radical SAM/SPASM domain-containing protein [Dissulfurispira sp.]|uniref:radical SAM/SPASM domain-containing protein n=1 Tax=Dissulfurispira sp. TaxID=2817609 RepID=UPI002FD8C067